MDLEKEKVIQKEVSFKSGSTDCSRENKRGKRNIWFKLFETCKRNRLTTCYDLYVC